MVLMRVTAYDDVDRRDASEPQIGRDDVLARIPTPAAKSPFAAGSCASSPTVHEHGGLVWEDEEYGIAPTTVERRDLESPGWETGRKGME